jgi:hypothetical protein
MDWFHEQHHTTYRVALDDWETIQRLADLIAPYADVDFNASDVRGSYGAENLETFKAKIVARDQAPSSVSIDGHTPGSNRVSAHVTLWPEHDAEYILTGTDEEAVLFLKARIESIVGGAGVPVADDVDVIEDDMDANGDVAPSLRPRGSFLGHPNWAGIGVIIGAVLTIVGIVIAILLAG